MSEQKISAIGAAAPPHEPEHEAVQPAYCCAPIVSSICSYEEPACCESLWNWLTDAANHVLYFFNWLIGNTDMQIGERILETWSMREIPNQHEPAFAQVQNEWQQMLDAMPQQMHDYVKNRFGQEASQQISWPEARSEPDEPWTEDERNAVRSAMDAIPGNFAVLRFVRAWIDRERCKDLTPLQAAAWVYQVWHARELPAPDAHNYPLVQAEWVDHLWRRLSGPSGNTVYAMFKKKHDAEIRWPKVRSEPGSPYTPGEQRAIEEVLFMHPGDLDCLETLRVWIALETIKTADAQATEGLDDTARTEWFCQKWQNRAAPSHDDPNFNVVVTEWERNLYIIADDAFSYAWDQFAAHYKDLIPSLDSSEESENAVRALIYAKVADPIFLAAVAEWVHLQKSNEGDS